MGMTKEAKELLNQKLDKKHVATRNQSGFTLSYIEGWHAIAEANRIFDFDGWTRETVELIENTQPTQNEKGNYIVSFRAKVRVSVDQTIREGIGFGSGIAKDIHDAYEGAIKEAETDAMKRALMTFGNPFGLALYDKKQENVGTNEKTLDGVKYSDLLKRIQDAPTQAELKRIKEERDALKDEMNVDQLHTLIIAQNKRLAELKTPPVDHQAPLEGTVQ